MPKTSSPKHYRVLFAVLGALATVSPFSIDMYLPAFDLIAKDLGTSTEKVAFSLSSYFVGLAVGQLIYGPFLDRFGRKGPLLLGLSLYVVASLACASASSVEALILFRFVQALGGCAAQVASVAMVRDLFPQEARARVFSRLMLIVGISPLFAPTIGGFVVVLLGWKAIFYILGLLVFAFGLLTYFGLPETQKPDPDVQLAPLPILKTFASIFRVPEFRAFAMAGAFSFSGLFAYLAAAPSIFLSHFNLSSLEFSAVFALLSVGMVGGGQFNIFLGRRFSGVQILNMALCLQAITAVIFLLGNIYGIYGLVAHLLILFVSISCVGLTYPNAAVLALAPFDRNSGSAAALLGTLQMLVGALASAFFGLLSYPASLSLSLIFTGAAFGSLIFIRPRRP